MAQQVRSDWLLMCWNCTGSEETCPSSCSTTVLLLLTLEKLTNNLLKRKGMSKDTTPVPSKSARASPGSDKDRICSNYGAITVIRPARVRFVFSYVTCSYIDNSWIMARSIAKFKSLLFLYMGHTGKLSLCQWPAFTLGTTFGTFMTFHARIHACVVSRGDYTVYWCDVWAPLTVTCVSFGLNL